MTEESPGVAVLRTTGCTIEQLAAIAGVNPALLTAELVGRRGLSDATMDALRGLLSPHAAEQIAALAGASRAAYLEQVQTGRM